MNIKWIKQKTDGVKCYYEVISCNNNNNDNNNNKTDSPPIEN